MLDEFREAIRSAEPYYLCLGNCYILSIKSEYHRLLDRKTYYINFQGASDKGLYCYSLLNGCKGIFFFSAWANIASVVTSAHFAKWRKILDELLMLECTLVMVDAPIVHKNYKNPFTKKGISLDKLKSNRKAYFNDIIKPIHYHPNMIYKDMADLVGYDYKHLMDKYPTKAPWHLNSVAVKKVTRHFVKIMISGKDQPLSL